MIDAVAFNKVGGWLELLDQTLLPVETRIVKCHTEHEIAHAIVSMQVRGAPAIGVAAAYGIVLGLTNPENQHADFAKTLSKICKLLADTRPTAVNLFWAIERVKKVVLENAAGPRRFR